MDEINTQRRKKPVWPWVILALIVMVGAVALYWKYYQEPVNDPVVPNSTGFHPAASDGGTAFFSAYVLQSRVYSLV